ncbi:MAG: sugar-transfer associated ATP-grasp domain-containing protein [Candidatus Woesebacteria bacterium]|jgi:alpha-L-glutamate ligase-like protein
MIKANEILGMNARNQLYTSFNSNTAKAICSSKYATKILLGNNNIPTAKLYGILGTIEDINDYDWKKLEKDFVIKPTNGNAGKGVVAFSTKHKNKLEWKDRLGEIWDLEDIKLHCFDILEGQYSTYGDKNHIIIEERVPIHPKLLRYTYKGTPDIRVIVFNSVPIMALLRLPTEESEGRANQSQGAIGVGIDMATGITTYAAAHKNQLIKYLPGTKKKLNGIIIPFWTKVLKTAIEASNAAKLMFSGVDIFLHKEQGPMVVELNANPGLSIQVANKAGLRRRLERVEDLNVLNPDHGVRISQALFAESFADKIKAKEGLTIVQPREEVIVQGENKVKQTVTALINTGRYRSAISGQLSSQLGLIDVDDLLWFQQEAGEGKVPVVEIKVKLKEKRLKTAMIVSKKLNKGKHRIEIGRKDLAGFLVGVGE